MPPEWPNFSFTMCSNTSASTTPWYLTEAPNSHLPSPENWHDSSTMMTSSPPHITLKQMDKQNEPIKRWKFISASSVPTTLRNGWTSFPPLSFTITPFCIAPLKFHHSPCYMDMNLEHIHPWERPSSQPWRTTWQLWKKPEKKHWQHMKLPVESWGNETLGTFPLGKLETRYGWKQPIFASNTSLGNWLPNDKDPLKYLKCFPHSHTASAYLPPGKYTMSSTLPFFPPTKRPKHMVLTSQNHHLT